MIHIRKVAPLEPPYCLAHAQMAPCLCCLEAEVSEMVLKDNCFDFYSVIFAVPNMDDN